MTRRILPALLLSLLIANASAAEPTTAPSTERLPEPLTLEAALASVDDTHPALMTARSAESRAAAQLKSARAVDDALLNLNLEARYVDPQPSAPDQSEDDSRASLILSKTLYDFGRTGNAVDAGKHILRSRQQQSSLTRQQLRREIMARYFDVILADTEAARANEAMSIAFIRFDRLKDQFELDMVSDVELLAQEDEYQKALLARTRAESAQRQTRTQLALSLNRPDQLSSDLEPVALPGLEAPLPAFDQLLEETLANNAGLNAVRSEIQATQKRKKAARAERNPRLYGQLEAWEYRREFGSRDPFIAAVGLDIPLYQGDRSKADIALAEADLQALEANTKALEYQLRQELLDTVQSIQTLQQQIGQAEIRSDYRDLYLDRSRAQYDLEIRSDLGDAMTEQTAARLFFERTEFQLALAREKLVELTGNPDYSALTSPTAAAQASPKPDE